MKYSVIIPVYNVENYLHRCINSILTQEYIDLEILLIDNGSEDSSGILCDNYAERFSNVTTYHIPNHGVSAARNFGLAKAQGEFICFVDADDYLVGNLFSDMENQLDSEIDLLVFSYYNSLEKNLSETARSSKILPIKGKKDRNQFIDLFTELFLSDMMYTVWNKIYRREFLEEHRIMFEQYELGEDVRFNLNVYRNVNKVYLSQESYYVYVIGRKGSAMSGYNPKRLQYQLEELKLIDSLLSDWNLDSFDFEQKIKARILMSNIYNISKQNIQVSSKVNYVKDICENKDIKSFIHTEENDLKPFINYLLKQKRYSTVLFLKMVQALIKRS